MKQLKISTIIFGIALIVLSFGYINNMVSYKYEVDLMETNIQTDNSLSEKQKKQSFLEIEKRKKEISNTQHIIKILICVFLLLFLFFLYLLLKK